MARSKHLPNARREVSDQAAANPSGGLGAATFPKREGKEFWVSSLTASGAKLLLLPFREEYVACEERVSQGRWVGLRVASAHEEQAVPDEIKPHNIIIGQRVTEQKIELSRQMRKKMTISEKALWARLVNGALGANFRRQQIIDGFIVDFYCHSAGLAVEVDGPIHKTEYDRERDLVLNKRGIKTIRFTDQDVLKRVGWVLVEIKKCLRERNNN